MVYIRVLLSDIVSVPCTSVRVDCTHLGIMICYITEIIDFIEESDDLVCIVLLPGSQSSPLDVPAAPDWCVEEKGVVLSSVTTASKFGILTRPVTLPASRGLCP